MTPAQIEHFFATLQTANPLPASELEYTSVFELLTAVLLSAQATDVGVNKATRRLFAVANTPQQILGLGLERLELEVRMDNAAARRCYERAGFQLEGVKRHAFFSDGAFCDVGIMSILRQEYRG